MRVQEASKNVQKTTFPKSYFFAMLRYVGGPWVRFGAENIINWTPPGGPKGPTAAPKMVKNDAQ